MNLATRAVDLLYRAATSRSPIRILLTPIGALSFFTFLLLLVFAALRLDKAIGFPRFPRAPLNSVASLPLLILGLFLTLWSVLHFLKSGGSPVPLNPPPKLVITGPYVYVRNPMLLGVFALLFGLGIWLESITLAFVFSPALILLAIWELKVIEEPELEKRLGQEYIEYRKTTPMFIPRFGSVK